MYRLAMTAVMGALLAGCTATAEPDAYDVLSQRDPADPAREVAAEPYRSVLAGYHPRNITEPKPWADTATPAEKAGDEQQ